MSSATRPASPEAFTGPGLYLHVPFCSAICPYCDFAVMTGGPRRHAGYLESLLAEIDLHRGWPWTFDTIYLGGGTPSALAPEVLAEILEGLGRALRLASDTWLFLEANPEDVTAKSLAEWRRLGVRTLSLGVQSFDAGGLRFLGRRHDPAGSRRSIELAREAGFHTVSVDLIYGLPGQEAAAWRRDLEEAVRLAPDHLSCYQLTVHEGTQLGRRRARGELVELPDAAQAELFRLTHTFLEEAGYRAYEVSSFAASPGHRSRHNRKYWRHVPYLGLGPSAHSFSGVEPAAGGGRCGRRWWNERRLTTYRGRLEEGARPVAGSEELGATELLLERLMLGLRTREGVDLEEVRERYGTDLLAANRETVERWAEEGLLELEAGCLRPTLEGFAVADSLARGFELGG